MMHNSPSQSHGQAQIDGCGDDGEAVSCNPSCPTSRAISLLKRPVERRSEKAVLVRLVGNKSISHFCLPFSHWCSQMAGQCEQLMGQDCLVEGFECQLLEGAGDPALGKTGVVAAPHRAYEVETED